VVVPTEVRTRLRVLGSKVIVVEVGVGIDKGDSPRTFRDFGKVVVTGAMSLAEVMPAGLALTKTAIAESMETVLENGKCMVMVIQRPR
jgi:hypothetical protein